MDLPTSSLYPPVPQYIYFSWALWIQNCADIWVKSKRLRGKIHSIISCSDTFFSVPIWKSWALLQPASCGRWQPKRMNTTNACCPLWRWQLSLWCYCICIRAVHGVYCTLLTDLWPAGLAGDTGRDNATILLLELRRVAVIFSRNNWLLSLPEKEWCVFTLRFITLLDDASQLFFQYFKEKINSCV